MAPLYLNEKEKTEHYNEMAIRLTAKFSIVTVEDRKLWNGIFKMLREKLSTWNCITVLFTRSPKQRQFKINRIKSVY